MKKKILSIISMIMAVLMLSGVCLTTLASCVGPGNNENDDSTSESSSQNSTSEPEGDDSKESGSETSKGEGETNNNAGGDTEVGGNEGGGTEGGGNEGGGNEGGGNEGGGEVVGPVKPKTEPLAPSIDYANYIVNGVQSFYTDASRQDYRIENLNMNIDFSLAGTKKVSSITNKNGAAYVNDTMDVYVVGANGNKVFASQSSKSVRPNIYRIGYYYYDVHMLDANFSGDYNVLRTKDVNCRLFDAKNTATASLQANSTRIQVKGTGSGTPYIYMGGGKDKFNFSASDFNALQFTMTSKNVTSVKLYFIAGSNTGHTEAQSVKISTIPDGKAHTYTMLFTEGANFTGDVWRLRFDLAGATADETIIIQDVKLANVEATGVTGLYFDRTFHTYPDKVHQELHFIATKQITGIQEMGMVTEIAKDTVAKLIVKDDATALHTSIDGVNWDKAEYVGFDIKDVGVFGYILPVHENAGKIKVELVGDNYVITQTFCPKDGTINPIATDDPETKDNEAKLTNTTNDFFTGNRIYTDENHDFDVFVAEAENERNPLTKAISSGAFIGYDALDGAYTFDMAGTGFNAPFFYDWNNHYSVSAMIRSDVDRNVYIRTIAKSGCLENAAILNANDLVMPIPAEVSKNFGGENEEPLFSSGDMEFGETVFPLVLPAKTRIEFTVLNLYQNWGQFPLKQLSSISYFWPYYHLSLGTTETSCISPWYGARDLWTLPDFRSQSQPYWFELEEGKGYSNQPQHTHAGYQYFLQYTDADGKYSATENISNVIDSSGPVYVDVAMDYISDDGKIKISYNHIEFPQEDELRAYYEIEYEILDEITIKDFKNNFSFYSFEGYAGQYRKLGYLDENNQPAHKDANLSETPEMFVLGDRSPYVSLYDLNGSGSWEYNNANLGFIIYNSEFIFGGEECTENFVISGAKAKYSLSLNLDEVTLKPGDTMKINMIISPWGSVNSTDDTNVQKMRENTCLDPLKVEVANGEKIESVFTPKVMSTDGKTAEFTLSGGTSYVPVRIYGMEKLTAPKIYEKVMVEGKEEWVEYAVNTVDAPDNVGNRHYYDGYFVYYDQDGTYSYAFDVDMTDVESRTFRIDTEEDFVRWPVINTGNTSSLNVYVNAGQLYIHSGTAAISGIGKAELSADASYMSYYGDGGSTPEAYFNVYSNSDKTETGKYIVIKFRIPSSNTNASNLFEFYSSTINAGATPGDSVSVGAMPADDKWHVVVVDASLRGNTFKGQDENKFYAKYLRLDVFNTSMAADDRVDVAYVGFVDEISQVGEHERQYNDVERIEVLLVGSHRQYYDLYGNMVEETDSPTVIPDRVYVDPDNKQGYTQSGTSYVAGIDFINGKGDGEDGNPAYNSYRSSDTEGVKVIKYNGGTHENAYLVLSGWSMAYEGISKYVWSADGGKTWFDAVPYPSTRTFAAATGGIKNAAVSQFTATVAGFDDTKYNQDYYANAVYQGAENVITGLGAHLVDYIGQEVNVTFAAVPNNDPDGLCILAHITNVRVYASSDDAAAGEQCTHEEIVGYKFIEDNDPNTEVAKIVGTCRCGEKTFDMADPSYVMFFGNINGVTTSPHVAETKNPYLVFDATGFTVKDQTLSFQADADGNLKMVGWAGVNGGIQKIVFKVFDANGNEKTNGWTDSFATLTSRGDLNSEMQKRGIEITYGTGYEFTLPLAGFISAKDESVTVKIAFQIKKAVGGDKYVYVCDINNVKVPSEPVEYVPPVLPDNSFVACTDGVTGSSVITTGDRTKTEPVTYDFGTVTSRGDAHIKLTGWVAVDGGFSTLAYKVTADGVDSEWINFNGGYNVADTGVQNAVVGEGFAKEEAYRFDVSPNLVAYVGKTVAVTFAVVANNDGEYIPFFIAKNVKVICDHNTMGSDYTFVTDDDAYTDEAKIASKCICGEKTINAKTPSYVFHIQEVIGSASVLRPATAENKKGYITIDCVEKGITLDANGVIEIDGWGGVNGGSGAIVYRVYDANGVELTYEWTEFDVARVYASNTELTGEMTGRGIEVEYGMRFMDMKVNLANYLEGRDSITVKFAMVCDGAPEESNDKYVYLFEFKNLKAASAN